LTVNIGRWIFYESSIVHELVSKLNKPYKAFEERLKAYWIQFLLIRVKEGNKYRYAITEKGKMRLDYLKKGCTSSNQCSVHKNAY
jgi:hypothetical protein